MCLTFFLVDVHPTSPLIVLFNRDERFDRPALPLHQWKEGSKIVAGRDLAREGTWAGVSTDGRFACITSEVKRGPRGRSPTSRGELVTEFLDGQMDPERYMRRVLININSYSGFNLVVGDVNGLFHVSTLTRKVTKLSRGIHGLSNADLDTPWPKVDYGKERLRDLVDCGLLCEASGLELMTSSHAIPSSMTEPKWHRIDKLFVHEENYGTRATSYIRWTRDGLVSFTEWTHGSESAAKTRKNITF